MEMLARVRETYEDGTALVSVVQEKTCCGDCQTCAMGQTVPLLAKNPIAAHPGELVTLTIDSGAGLTGVAAIYLMPLVLFFPAYFAGDRFLNAGPVTGCLAFVLGIVCIVACRRLSAKKQNTVYTITGYPSQEVLESQIKGDNDLD